MQEQPLEKHTALEPWAGQAARAHHNEGSSMDYSPKAPRAPHPRPFGTYCIGTFPGNPGSSWEGPNTIITSLGWPHNVLWLQALKALSRLDQGNRNFDETSTKLPRNFHETSTKKLSFKLSFHSLPNSNNSLFKFET
jgi:hypothetical protein